MNAYTPGPWMVGETHVYFTDSVSIMAPDGSAVACTTRGGKFFDANGDSAPAYPNARLIAAAPELVEALRRFMSASDDENDMDALYVQQCRELARAALAKAGAP